MNQFLKRTGALVILLLSLTWLCRDPDWEPLIAFVAALIAHIGLDYWHTVRAMSAHDLDLVDRFLELVPPDSDTVSLLRTHDLAVPFHYTSIEPLFQMHDCWKGVAFEFDDKKLEKAKVVFFGKLKEFVPMLAGETWPHDKNPDLITMDFHDWNNPPEKIAIRDQLNRLGTELLEEYEKFVRVIRSNRKGTEQTSRANESQRSAP